MTAGAARRILPILRQEISARSGRYTRPMPSRVCIQLRKVATPRYVPHGVTVEFSTERGELTVKDQSGAIIGAFKDADVSGWWVEGIPLKVSQLTQEDLDSLSSGLEGVVNENPEGGDSC